MATLGLASALSEGHRLEDSRAFLPIAVAIALVIDTAVVMAASFGPVHYDPTSDQLIVTMIYDGTNPDHHFSVQWGPCRKLDRPARQKIEASILDDQWNDAAKKTFTQTVRIPPASLSCRPATVTLRSPPNFYTSLDIPARS